MARLFKTLVAIAAIARFVVAAQTGAAAACAELKTGQLTTGSSVRTSIRELQAAFWPDLDGHSCLSVADYSQWTWISSTRLIIGSLSPLVKSPPVWLRLLRSRMWPRLWVRMGAV